LFSGLRSRRAGFLCLWKRTYAHPWEEEGGSWEKTEAESKARALAKPKWGQMKKPPIREPKPVEVDHLPSEENAEDAEFESPDFSADSDDPEGVERRADNLLRVMMAGEENPVELKRKKEAFKKKFLEEGDESMLDPRTRKLIKPSDPGLFSMEGDRRLDPKDMSPRVRELMAPRIADERLLSFKMNEFVTENRDQERMSGEEQLGNTLKEATLKQDLRDARLQAEVDFQLIGFLTSLEDSQAKRLKKKKKKGFQAGEI